jgi:hypothetical protein
MNRITLCCSIASVIASRMGLDSVVDMERSWLSVGVDVLRALGLQRQGVDRATDLRAEDLVDETVLLDPAAPVERRCGDRGTEMVAAAGVVLDLGVCARYGGFDALLYLFGLGHRLLE